MDQNKKIEEQNEKIQAQDERIQQQEVRINEQDSKLNILRDRLAVLSGVIDYLKVSSDNQEQYSRRTCLRINGIKSEKDETAENCLEKVQKVCKDLNVEIPYESFERAHRIGREKKTIIVKFTSFKYRTLLYRNRRKDGPIKIHLDITKKRLDLLDKAKALMTENCGVDFVFADINCNTVARMSNNSYKFFSTLEQFTDLLQ